MLKRSSRLLQNFLQLYIVTSLALTVSYFLIPHSFIVVKMHVACSRPHNVLHSTSLMPFYCSKVCPLITLNRTRIALKKCCAKGWTNKWRQAGKLSPMISIFVVCHCTVQVPSVNSNALPPHCPVFFSEQKNIFVSSCRNSNQNTAGVLTDMEHANSPRDLPITAGLLLHVPVWD